MMRPWNGAMPVLLSMPLRTTHYRRVERRRRRGFVVATLLALGLGLLAAGFWMPAKAELAQQLLGRAWQRTAAAPGASVIAPHRDTHLRSLAELELGDVLTLERPNGSVLTYTVDALDVVDSERAELRLDADESIVVLVTYWPFDAVDVGGSWRYVVTARERF